MDTQSPKLAIVIPCYNHAQYLPDAIESARSQTIPCEIIVVDDGSTDDSIAVARSCGIEPIIQQNKGASNARNNAIRATDTEWILCLDADDKISPDFVEKCLKEAKEHNADIVGAWQHEFGEYDRVYKFGPEPTYQDFRIGNRINVASIFRKKMWEDLGEFDEEMRTLITDGYEDWDFWLRATKNGYKVRVVQEPLFHYRKHGESMITNTVRHHKELYDYIMNKLNGIPSQNNSPQPA